MPYREDETGTKISKALSLRLAQARLDERKRTGTEPQNRELLDNAWNIYERLISLNDRREIILGLLAKLEHHDRAIEEMVREYLESDKKVVKQTSKHPKAV